MKSTISLGDGRMQKRLPHIGILTSALICADLCYSGCVETPTPAQMGWLVADTDMSAKVGLQVLGMVDRDASNKEVKDAFVQCYEYP